MSIVLYHHPRTRAASVVWMLEEAGCEYELRHVDMLASAHKAPELLALNPMGKLPILVDGEAVVTEVAAVGLYLADRYAPGRLAPALDDPARGTYLRWSLFSPSVVEPAVVAHSAGWKYGEAQVGWGNHGAMLDSLDAAIGDGPWLLGDRFSMADVILGGTVAWLLGFKMLEARPRFTAYVERLNARPARKAANARNAEVMASLSQG